MTFVEIEAKLRVELGNRDSLLQYSSGSGQCAEFPLVVAQNCTCANFPHGGVVVFVLTFNWWWDVANLPLKVVSWYVF